MLHYKDLTTINKCFAGVFPKVMVPGCRRNMVRGIERIQNAKLWAKYSLRRAEVSEARAGNPNEMMLFHGADRDTLKVKLLRCLIRIHALDEPSSRQKMHGTSR